MVKMEPVVEVLQEDLEEVVMVAVAAVSCVCVSGRWSVTESTKTKKTKTLGGHKISGGWRCFDSCSTSATYSVQLHLEDEEDEDEEEEEEEEKERRLQEMPEVYQEWNQ